MILNHPLDFFRSAVPPAPLPMNYEETFVAGKRDREVRPRKLDLDDDDESKENDVMALYGRKKPDDGGKSTFAKPAAVPPTKPAKPVDTGASSEASMFR